MNLRLGDERIWRQAKTNKQDKHTQQQQTAHTNHMSEKIKVEGEVTDEPVSYECSICFDSVLKPPESLRNQTTEQTNNPNKQTKQQTKV